MTKTLTAEQQDLVVRHMPLATMLAKKINFGELADSVAEAHLGLIEAAFRFDPGRGLQFGTYAVYWIRAKLLNHAVRERQGQVRYVTSPVDRKVHFKLHKVLRQFANSDEVSDAVAAKLLGVKEDAVSKARNRDRWRNVALDALTEQGGSSLEILKDDRESSDDVLVIAQELEQLRRAVRGAVLNQRQRQVVRLRLLSEEPLTLKELAVRWGISRERVRQIELQAIRLIGKELVALRRPARSRRGRLLVPG